MTALISLMVLAVVWENHFNSYTQQNMQYIAESVAEDLSSVISPNSSNSMSTMREYMFLDIGVEALDNNGNVIYSKGGSRDGASDIASAPIVVDNNVAGTVSVWRYGTSSLIAQEFKDNSYGAMIFAAIVAVIIAFVIGYFVARGVVSPIRRITHTAHEIKGGNLKARTGLVGTDEIAQLGMTFDDMAQSIENDRELERRLTNDVAHELRTPLMAMQATMEAMVDGVLPADEERLVMLDNEVIRLGKLVDALLKLTRLENRSTSMKARELDLGEELKELVLNHQMLLADANLKFEYAYEPGIMVMADPDLIKQATANILSNAVRYTPEGGEISIEVTHDNVMAQIRVSDTGIGMSEEDLSHIFSRFWRADRGRQRASGGLGVGLAIVKEIADRHEGWVDVQSELGQGSTFVINIPLIKEDPSKQGKRKQDKQGALQVGNLTKILMFPAKTEEQKEAERLQKAKKAEQSKQRKEAKKKAEEAKKPKKAEKAEPRQRWIYGNRAKDKQLEQTSISSETQEEGMEHESDNNKAN